jgi:hypothetical protein
MVGQAAAEIDVTGDPGQRGVALALTPELAFIIALQPPKLTERQVEVLHLYGTGCTLDATAHRLRISVRTHLNRIYAKFAAAGDPIRDREDIPPRVRDYEIGHDRGM